ncbi:MAG: HEAT repeat domain-containing protein, partial [Planctomycetota bacterium]|nr:HEAT repeat domain-containing protein [Planctomycetota bacterium]
MRLLILFGTLLTIRAEGEMTVPEFPLPDVRKLLAEVLPPRRKAPETRELIAKAADSRRNMYDEWRNRLFLADDPKDVALFRSLLDSPNPLFRAAACRYVARVRDAQSWGKVLSRSGDPDAMVRRYAAEALGEFRRIQALPKLATLLNDPDSLVQGCVPSAAGKILRAHPPEQVLERVGAPDSKLTGPLLARLLDSLVGRREPSCVPLLIELLGERHSLPQDFSPEKALRRFAGPIHSAAREKLRETWHDWWERTALDAGPDEARKPQQSWHGCSLVIAPPQQDVLSPEVTIKHQFRTESDWYPFVVPVKDEGLPGYLQYVIFADGREVERGETSDRMKLPPGSMVRYWSEAYGSRAAIWAARWPTDRFEPKVGPGTYEVQLEARYLCTERVADNFGDMGTFAMGPTVSVGEVFTLKSNRRRLVLRPRTEKLSAASLARLAEALAAPPKGKPRAVEVKLVDIKEGSTSSPRAVSLRGRRSCLRALRGAGEAGLEAVLKSFDPGSATSTQLYYLEGVDSDLAMAALLRAAAAGRWSTPEDRKNKLLEEATAEVGSERWRWHRSRQALQYLDG